MTRSTPLFDSSELPSSGSCSRSGKFTFLKELTGCQFGFYSADEIRKVSVKRIVTPISFDALGHPLEGGLYDPALGPLGRENGSCVTCGLNVDQCPGHVGHIELVFPVYNPLVFMQLYRLLGQMCFNCHQFRHSRKQVRLLRVKLLLCEANLYTEAKNLLDDLRLAERGANAKLTKILGDKKKGPQITLFSQDAERLLSRRENEARARLKVVDPALLGGNEQRVKMQTHSRSLWTETVKAFLASSPQKCLNCEEPKCTLKHEGYVKIFKREARNVLSQDHKKMLKTAKRMAVTKKRLEKKKKKQAASGGSDGDDEQSNDEDSSNSDSSESSSASSDEHKSKRVYAYMNPSAVSECLRLLWKNELSVVTRIWGRDSFKSNPHSGYMLFFCQTLLVPASRFRPPASAGDMKFEHPQNSALQGVLKLDDKIRRTVSEGISDETGTNLVLQTWVDLQNAVNGFIDSSRSPTVNAPPGVRQVLEKKEGLFRQNMMGKRVNYAARSVISPDPYIGTDEVGLPVRFAKKLSFPEPVTSWNAEQLAGMVRNGADTHPGALFIEDVDGKMIDLSKRSERQREQLALDLVNVHVFSEVTRSGKIITNNHRRGGEDDALFKEENRAAHAPLLMGKQKKVWRHARSGDVMLANRQPTLHKPSLMAHKVRVIENESMQTIRLHYANCNSYNADFDGDEINLHLPQSELCRAEAYEIAYTNHQYCSTTDGKPLRGLIQDHVGMGVMLTKQDCFLSKELYTQLVYIACGHMKSNSRRIHLLPPTILKPERLWTGKQVITTILIHLVGSTDPEELLTFGPRKSKIPSNAWTVYPERKLSKPLRKLLGEENGLMGQTQVIVRQGVLCSGVLDKAQFGASEHGLVHSIYELYGPTAAGELLSAFGRLFTYCAQIWGHTCAIEDLLLNREAEAFRTKAISKSVMKGVKVSAKFANCEDVTDLESVAKQLERRIRVDVKGENDEALLDGEMQRVTNEVTSEIIRECLPKGQRKPFPNNCFSLMVHSGAKGSLVNHSQISCALGQQALEGRRVPRTVNGKSLPCFSPFDPTPRSGGFVSDRFLSGVRPQEYYFHCMAGREGLIDTAVKTARSGYLQRCLVKHLENLSVGYDRTVRQPDGSCVQFSYGGDGLDALNTSYLNGSKETLSFLHSNSSALGKRLGSTPNDFDSRMTAKLRALITKSMRKKKKIETQQSYYGCALFTGACVKARKPKLTTATSAAEDEFAPGLHPGRIVKIHRDNGTCDVNFEDGDVCNVPILLDRDDDSRTLGVIGRIPDPVMSQLEPDLHLGSICESLQDKLEDYLTRDPDNILKSEEEKCKLEELVFIKYLRSLCAPGENVGVIAAQGIGEPSTQMTLNTFHLAGHGAGNVTLGIPRLRELLMAAAKNIKTPSMLLPLLPSVSRQEAGLLKSSLHCFTLLDLLRAHDGIQIKECLCRTSQINGTVTRGESAALASTAEKGSGVWHREYNVELRLEDLNLIKSRFGIPPREILAAAGQKFFALFVKKFSKESTRNNYESTKLSARKDFLSSSASKKKTIAATTALDETEMADRRDGDDSEDDDVEEAENVDKAAEAGENDTLRLGRKNEVDGYDDDDDEEEEKKDAADSSSSSEDDDDDQDNGIATKNGRTAAAQKKKKYHDEDEDQHEGGVPVDVATSIVQSGCYESCTYFKQTATTPAMVRLTLRVDASAQNVLMIDFAEKFAKQVVVRGVDNVKACYITETSGEDKRLQFQTDGCNFEAIWEHLHGKVDLNKIYSNDVNAILLQYGVEAARSAIVKEVKGVFGVYGIGVDERHLGLVADYMTFEGAYRALNRVGINSSTSPFVRITFETSASFLTQAALEGETDALLSSSSRLCLGQLLLSGTGAFDLLVPSKKNAKPKSKKKSRVMFATAETRKWEEKKIEF